MTTENQAIGEAVAGALAASTATEPVKNFFRGIFDAPRFEPVDNPRKYPNADGSVSMAIANVLIPYRGVNVLALTATIRLRKQPKRSPVIELSFPRNSLKGLDDAAVADLLDYRRWILTRYKDAKNGKITTGAAGSLEVQADGFEDDDSE